MRLRQTLLLVGALFLCAKSHCLTLSDAETEVRRLVKDTATSASLQRYSDTVIDAFLNQSQREVVNATWCLQKSTSIALVTGTTYYSLPSDLIVVKLINFKDSANRKRELTETSYKAVRQNNPDYERTAGPPAEYTIRASTTNATTLDICFLPVAGGSSTGTITVDYMNQSTDLSSDSTVFLDGDIALLPYHETIVYQTVSKIKLLEGDTAMASAYLQLYTASIQAMNSRLGEKPNLSPGFSAGNTSNSSAR